MTAGLALHFAPRSNMRFHQIISIARGGESIQLIHFRPELDINDYHYFDKGCHQRKNLGYLVISIKKVGGCLAKIESYFVMV